MFIMFFYFKSLLGTSDKFFPLGRKFVVEYNINGNPNSNRLKGSVQMYLAQCTGRGHQSAE